MLQVSNETRGPYSTVAIMSKRNYALRCTHKKVINALDEIVGIKFA